MTHQTHTFSNGLRLVCVPHSSQVVYCGYYIKAGTRDELSHEEGLAHFCEHMSFKGTAKRSARNIINSLEQYGGDLNAFTTKETTVYHAAILSKHVYKAVEVLTDMVFNSVYPQKEIAKEVEVICDEIESYNDSPSELIYDYFEQELFGCAALGHNILGKAENVRQFTTADAQRFTQRMYQPSNMVFFVYGDIDFKRLVQQLDKLTSAFPEATPYLQKDALLPTDISKTTGVEGTQKVIKRNTHQCHVMIGAKSFSVYNKQRVVLYLLNNILGGPGMNARFSIALREKRGLVYSVDSSMVCYSDVGVWSVYFGCDPHDLKKCINLVKKEMQRLCDTMLTAKQIASAKQQLKGQIAVSCDSRESFALDFSKAYLYFNEMKSIDDLFAEIDAITPQEIMNVSREIFDPNRLFTLILE